MADFLKELFFFPLVLILFQAWLWLNGEYAKSEVNGKYHQFIKVWIASNKPKSIGLGLFLYLMRTAFYAFYIWPKCVFVFNLTFYVLIVVLISLSK